MPASCDSVPPQRGDTPLQAAYTGGYIEIAQLLELALQPWSRELLPLWPPAARRRVRALMLMLRRGRALRARPEDDPRDYFAHALPTEVEADVLGAVGLAWLL